MVKSQNPLVQIVVRAAWIIFWMYVIALVIAGTKYKVEFDFAKGCTTSLIVSSIVQIFKKPDQPQTNQGRTAYQIKYSKLVNMVGGDRATADRLISAYGIDRAISDLERDRRIN